MTDIPTSLGKLTSARQRESEIVSTVITNLGAGIGRSEASHVKWPPTLVASSRLVVRLAVRSNIRRCLGVLHPALVTHLPLRPGCETLLENFALPRLHTVAAQNGQGISLPRGTGYNADRRRMVGRRRTVGRYIRVPVVGVQSRARRRTEAGCWCRTMSALLRRRPSSWCQLILSSTSSASQAGHAEAPETQQWSTLGRVIHCKHDCHPSSSSS